MPNGLFGTMAELEAGSSSRSSSSSRASSFSLCHMSESAYAKVIFCEIQDSYPVDSEVECIFQRSESVIPHPDDFIGLFRIGWHDSTECIVKVSGSTATIDTTLTGEIYNKVIFKAEDLPKDDLDYYQFIYLGPKDEICGGSTPFKFHNLVRDENVVVLSAEHDFLEVKSSTSILHHKLLETRKYVFVLEKVKKELEEKLDHTELEALKANEELMFKVIVIEREKQQSLEALEKIKKELEEKVTNEVENKTSLKVLEKEKKELEEKVAKIEAESKESLEVLEKAKMELQEKVAKIEAEKIQSLNDLKELNAKQSEEFESELFSSLKSIVSGSSDFIMPNCSERLQAIISALKSSIDNFIRSNSHLKESVLTLKRTLSQTNENLANYKMKAEAIHVETATTDLVKLRALIKENRDLKEMNCSLHKSLSNTKDVFACSEQSKNITTEELDKLKTSNKQITALLEEKTLVNELMKKQMAMTEKKLIDTTAFLEEKTLVNELMKKQMAITDKKLLEAEKVCKANEEEMKMECKAKEDIIENNCIMYDTCKSNLKEELNESEKQNKDLTRRLKEAADLYKKQYLKIRNLTKQVTALKRSIYYEEPNVDSPPRRLSSSSSIPSCEGLTAPSVISDLLLSISDSVDTSPVAKEESLPSQDVNAKCMAWSTDQDPAVEHFVQKNSATLDYSYELIDTPAMTSSTASAPELPPHYDTICQSIDMQCQNPTMTDMSLEQDYSFADYQACSLLANKSYDLPCPLCDDMITLYGNNTVAMEDHLFKVHNQQLCPVCGRMFDQKLPPHYFKCHVDQHFT